MKFESFQQIEDAFSLVAQHLVQLEESLKAQGELLQAMDGRLRLQQQLIDSHHAVLIASGLAKPRRPKRGTDAN